MLRDVRGPCEIFTNCIAGNNMMKTQCVYELRLKCDTQFHMGTFPCHHETTMQYIVNL